MQINPSITIPSILQSTGSNGRVAEAPVFQTGDGGSTPPWGSGQGAMGHRWVSKTRRARFDPSTARLEEYLDVAQPGQRTRFGRAGPEVRILPSRSGGAGSREQGAVSGGPAPRSLLPEEVRSPGEPYRAAMSQGLAMVFRTHRGRVRFPCGPSDCSSAWSRARASDARGRGFESLQSVSHVARLEERLTTNQEAVGSNPTVRMGREAELARRLFHTQDDVGSSPTDPIRSRGVARLIAPGCQPGGRGFESRRLRSMG